MQRALTRWDPFGELSELRTSFDRMVEQLAPGGRRTWAPPLDVIREDGRLIVRADVPGLKPEEVKIEVQDDILTVSGQHEETKEDRQKEYVRRERSYGSFSRSLVLPPGVDAKKITATTHDGTVEVKIPLPVDVQNEAIQITPSAA